MARLYFKFGAMGSSKTAQALMCKFNYEQKGFKVLLMKPKLDNRDVENGIYYVKSRIGLKSECLTFNKHESVLDLYCKNNVNNDIGVIIVDECQFCTSLQIDEFKEITKSIPVLCYGLKTDFKSELFEGSKRLLEIADSIQEVKSVCRCGAKATMNARIINGKVTTVGDSILIGGDESYEGMCYWCWKEAISKNKK